MELKWNAGGFFPLLLLLSCSSPKQSEVRPKEEIVVVDEDCDDELMVEDDEQLFVHNRDGFVYVENGGYMRKLYERKYSHKYTDYKSFKNAVLKNSVNPPLPKGMSIDDSLYDTEDRFLIDSSVVAESKTCDLESFIEKYCYIRNDHLIFKEEYPRDKKFTIAYFLWLTGEYVYWYGGYSAYDEIHRNTSLNPL